MSKTIVYVGGHVDLGENNSPPVPRETSPLGYVQTITVESSELIAVVSGGNRTIGGGEDAVLDLTASIDPDEVLKYGSASSRKLAENVFRTQFVRIDFP